MNGLLTSITAIKHATNERFANLHDRFATSAFAVECWQGAVPLVASLEPCTERIL